MEKTNQNLKERIEEVKSKSLKWIDLENDMVVAIVEISTLREQDINPNTMSREMFNQLTENIKSRGVIEQFPFCAVTEKGIEIIGGHHRVRSAREAQLKHIPIILDISGLSRDEIISKQLSHNSIAGESDDQMVLRLYKEIQDVDQRIAAYIDESMLNIPKEALPILPMDFDINFHVINLLFLPHQLEKFDRVITAIGDDCKEIHVADIEHWDKFKKTVNNLKGIENIKSIGAALSKMCDIVEEHYKENDERTEDPPNEG